MTSITPIRPYPALLLRNASERILVVADLHLGWEASLAQKGIHVPSQTSNILGRMLELIASCKPNRLVLLGDVKHSIGRVEMKEWHDIPDFLYALVKEVANIQIIPGNHDGNLEPLLPKTVEVQPAKGVAFGNVGLFHGHAWPAPELLRCRKLISGHVHPMVTFRDPLGFQIRKQVWIKAECSGTRLAKSLLERLGFKNRGEINPPALLQENFNVKLKTTQLLIMPSFNEFLGGQSINQKRLGKEMKSRTFIGPILRSGSIQIKDAETYLLDGTFLGRISQLETT